MKKTNVIPFTFVHPNDGKPIVSTLELFEGFGYKTHKALKKVITDYESEFLCRDFSNLQLTKVFEKSKGGRQEESYFLNERQFILLCLLVKNTPASVSIKSAIEVEFSKLRKITLQAGRKEALQYKRDTAKPMTDMLVFIREGMGKETKGMPHCSNEHRLCNWSLTGYYAPLDETTLDAYDAKLLGHIRQHNTLLMTRFIKQSERKSLLRVYADTYRAKNPKPSQLVEPRASYRIA